jgi:sugar lactone lactonase YvrE
MFDEEKRDPPEILSVSPSIGLPGGEVTLHCCGLAPLDLDDESLSFCGSNVKIEGASSQKLVTHIPDETSSHNVCITQHGMQSNPYRFILPQCIAYALHNVSNPVVTIDNEILAPFCGIQGQLTPVSVFLINQAQDKSPFVYGLNNIGALAVNARGEIFAASRTNGMVYAVAKDGSYTVFAEGFETPCSLAGARDGALYLAQTDGKIFRLHCAGRTELCAEIQPSAVCIHLTIDPEGTLYASSTQQIGESTLWTIENNQEKIYMRELAEYRGIAFDKSGTLYIALAEHFGSGIDLVHKQTLKRRRIVSGQDIVGLVFNEHNDMYIATLSKIYMVSNRHLMTARNTLEQSDS